MQSILLPGAIVGGLVLICTSWYIRGLFGISEGIHVSASASVAADKPFAFTKQIHV
jgi:hypothetical protein